MFITSLITWKPKSGRFLSLLMLHTIHFISETSRKLIAKKEKAEKDKASEGHSISLKEWRIPKKGGNYKMCAK